MNVRKIIEDRRGIPRSVAVEVAYENHQAFRTLKDNMPKYHAMWDPDKRWWEVSLRYAPGLLQHHISQDQYNWLLLLATDNSRVKVSKRVDYVASFKHKDGAEDITAFGATDTDSTDRGLEWGIIFPYQVAYDFYNPVRQPTFDFEANYYEILGVTQDADTRTIKREWRRMVKQWHPDVNDNKEFAGTVMIKLKEVRERLFDEGKRANYNFGLRISQQSQTERVRYEGHAYKSDWEMPLQTGMLRAVVEPLPDHLWVHEILSFDPIYNEKGQVKRARMAGLNQLQVWYENEEEDIGFDDDMWID